MNLKIDQEQEDYIMNTNEDDDFEEEEGENKTLSKKAGAP